MTTPPRYSKIPVFGPFKRIANAGSQGRQAMIRIIRSGELSGNPPAFSTLPAAQAYHGPLTHGEIGFEFYSATPPDEKWGPPYWRGRSDGSVWVEDDKAKLKIYVSRVTMGFEGQ